MRGSVSSVSVKGLRPEQEDRYVVEHIEDRGWALAVFDGHNGWETAEAAATLLPATFVRSLERYGNARAAVAAAVGVLVEETSHREEGSSVSLVYVDECAARAAVGILGDSPVIARDADGEVVHGPLHNTMMNPEDAVRAVARGAVLLGPYLCDPTTLEGVNLTRTIGDAAFGFLGRRPETISVALGAGSYVLVASDGLFTWQALTPETLTQRVDRLVSEGADAQAIVEDALHCGSDDNITAVLWRAED